MIFSMNRYIKEFKGTFFVTIIFAILSGFVDVGFTLLLKGVIDKVNEGNLHNFIFFCIEAIIAVIVLSIIIYLNRITAAYLIKKVNTKIKEDIYLSIQNIKISEYRKNNTGYFLSILSNDITLLQTDYFGTIINVIYEISIFICALTATIRINAYLCLFLTLLSLIPMVIPWLFNKTLGEYKKKYVDEMAKFTEKTKDILSSFEVVKAFNIQKKIAKEFSIHNNSMEISKYKNTKINAVSNTLSVAVMYITYFLSLLISGYMAIKDVISVGSMVASVNLVGCIANPLVAVSTNIATIKSTKLIRDKILKIIDYKSCDVEEKLEIESFNKSIEFKNVEFSYDEKNKVLNNINLTLYKNKKYAIVGDSGSGKSTLIKLLLNYYDTYKGKICIDGYDVKDIKSDSLFNLISMIQQDVFIFDDTIKNNITLFKEYDDELIKETLDKMGLTSLVTSLESGLETNMGENGSNFSGGQKQRIALSRAIINNSPIIILDESTASLDNDTAYRIENSLLTFNELTLISITHKLIKENLELYDEIIYVKEGKIVESGSFDELMLRKGYFYSLYMIQA